MPDEYSDGLIQRLNHNINNENPFKSVWNWFSAFSGVLGIASLAKGIIEWGSFISEWVDWYQFLAHKFFDFLFFWVPFIVPTELYDYLVIGTIITASHFKTLNSIDILRGYKHSIIPTGVTKSEILFRLFGWPVTFGSYWIKLGVSFDVHTERHHWQKRCESLGLTGEKLNKAIENKIYNEYCNYLLPKQFFRWFMAIVFGFVLLVIFNQAILGS